MYTHTEHLAEILLLAVTSVISALASLALIYFLFKSFHDPIRNFLILMILFLSFLDVCMSLSAGIYRVTLIFVNPFCVSNDPQSELYTWLAFLWGFAHRASIIIPFFFCLSIYLQIEWAIRRDEFKIKLLFTSLIFFISLIWACVPLCFEGYGISPNGTLTILNPLWNFFSFELPLILIILVIWALTLRSMIIMRRISLELQATPFLYFPIIVLSSYFFSLVRSGLLAADVEASWLYAILSIFISLQGIFNAIYCMAMTNSTKKSFLALFGCVQQEPEPEEIRHEEIDIDSISSDETPINPGSLNRDYEMPRIQGNL